MILIILILFILTTQSQRFIATDFDNSIFHQTYQLYDSLKGIKKYLHLTCKSKDILSILISDFTEANQMPHFPIYLQDEVNGINLPSYVFLELCNLKLDVQKNPFSMKVYRINSPNIIFQINQMDFNAKHIKITTTDNSIKFGFGQRFQKDFHVNNGLWTIWNRDRPEQLDYGLLNVSKQTYGHQPVYLARQNQSKKYHLIYFKNTYAMNIEVNQSKITYHVTGGHIHFLLFIDDQPQNVLKKYHKFIGPGHIPPFWAMGWHQCRWGYKSMDELETVKNKYDQFQIPLDTLWSDLDYMEQKQIFTVNQKLFPLNRFKQLLEDIHYIPLIDAGVSIKTHLAISRGKQMNVFIKKNNKDYIGTVWPGEVHYVDFLHPNSSKYWSDMLELLYNKINFSGVWLDMNQMTNFKNGTSIQQEYIVQHNESLGTMTIDLDTQHFNIYNSLKPLLHQEVHAYYGHLQSLSTYRFLKSKGKRPFIITRSNSVGTGRYAGHWTGDNVASWEYLRLSISGNFLHQIYGIQMVGADICGFHLNTTEQLCCRWMQLGVFYPFARNHNELRSGSQQPYVFSPLLIQTSRLSLNLRYSILKQYYTIFIKNKGLGSIYRPLFFQFPSDQESYNKIIREEQFMIGQFLMSIPILENGSSYKIGYFPESVWYSLQGNRYTGKMNISNKLPCAPSLFIRSGYILFLNEPKLRTRLLDQNFKLKIGFKSYKNSLFEARGSILSINKYEDSSLIDSCVENNCFYEIKVIANIQDKSLHISWQYSGSVSWDSGIIVKSIECFWPFEDSILKLQNLQIKIKNSNSYNLSWTP